MTRNAAGSVAAAEKKALTGHNESQDSQAMLFKHMVENGVGVYSSSPPPGDDLQTTKGAAVWQELQKRPELNQASYHVPNQSQSTNAPNASAPNHQPVAAGNSAKQSSQRLSRPDQSDHSQARSSHSSMNWDPDEIVQLVDPSTQPNPSPAIAPPSLSSRDDVLTQLPPCSAPMKKKKPKDMSSQSTTQPNEDRSYGQYDCDGSPHQPTQGSSLNGDPTLHEGDTGHVDFGLYPFDSSDTGHMDADGNSTRDHRSGSQPASVPPTANGHYLPPPETPALAQRLFPQGGGNGQLMNQSQLFLQTQWTARAKNASPTSSRPSPDVFGRHIVSSPLKDRGSATQHPVSSPSALRPPSSRPVDGPPSDMPRRDEPETPLHENVAETPLQAQFQGYKARNGLEPISEIRREHEDSDATRSDSQGSVDSDFDDDSEVLRRRAKSRREKASKSFPAVPVPRPTTSKAEVEVPSTNRTKSRKHRARTASEEYRAQCHGKYPTDNDEDDGTQETVADSQHATVHQHMVECPEQSQEKEEIVKDSSGQDTGMASGATRDKEQGEMIPETSPPGTSVEPPRSIGDILKIRSSVPSGVATGSLPVLSSGPGVPDLSRHSTLHEPSTSREPLQGRKLDSRAEPDDAGSSPSVVLASSHPGSMRRSTRLQTITTPASTPDQLPPSAPGTAASSLTALSSTPSIYPSSALNTEESRDDDDASGGYASSTAAATTAAGKLVRHGPTSSLLLDTPSPKRKIKTYSRSRKNIRKSGIRQSMRHRSISIDELAPSPPAVELDRKSGAPKQPRPSSINQQAIRGSQSKRGIFEGMVFAISFQERQQLQKSKEKHVDKTTVERLIREEGGRILADGFNTLFRFDTLQTISSGPSTVLLSSSLKLLDDKSGFTALIADGHSRKVKYMQALALGIPCLAPKWVTMCIAKRKVVDWNPYLLCAGPSALLGDAIRSRTLQPYDATTAKLLNVIGQRPKLLDQSNILLVMKKSKNEERRMHYIFLAQVLGASLERVQTLEEARVKLREKEAEGKRFDWVYVGDRLHDAQDALFGATSPERSSKKRKRQSTGSGEDDRPPKRIRTLSDELVIQSLILGRLIEDEEMEE
ncbi:hypothetical protein GGR56DRAFT_89404 [Xylariaceae sp. FL0804]|nr:hypothetical protein GGR56DRAFT_89404 [Xylariaceae sp. FL0804]